MTPRPKRMSGMDWNYCSSRGYYDGVAPDSPTKRAEGKPLDGSNPKRVPGTQVEIPRLRFSGFALGY